MSYNIWFDSSNLKNQKYFVKIYVCVCCDVDVDTEIVYY